MIVKMKKVSVITLSDDIENTLANLRELGVAHLEYRDAKSPDLQELVEKRSNAERASMVISQAVGEHSGKGKGVAGESMTDLDADTVIARTLEILSARRDVLEENERLSREYERLEAWGEFDPADIAQLSALGLPVRLYALPKDQFDVLDSEKSVYIVSRNKTTVRIALVAQSLEGIPEMVLPERGLSSIGAQVDKNRTKIADFGLQLASFTSMQSAIEERIADLDQASDFEKAKLSMEDAGILAHITGFVPEIKIGKITDAAKKHSWALLVKDPDEEDTVPVLLKNRRPVRIISPIFDLLGAMPGYREYDISFWFLMFFSLFFAMIIGDAGYGFIFLVLTIVTMVVQKAKGKSTGRELILFIVLSVATLIWGSLSGTWFGSEAIAQAVPFKYLVLEPISTFNPRSSETVKYLCFVIGTAQIILAHGWNFLTQIREKPRIKALGQLGWMVAVFGVFHLVLNLVLDPVTYPIPPYALYMIFGGLTSVVVFSEQDGKFFRGLLRGVSGLFSTFLDSIGAFADVISYIRLFAVGLATVEIAKSFNAIASEMGDSVVGLIGAVFVLIIGHGINIAMGALSVIVHGVRLNMLEFSGHLGMEWTGIQYAPFQKRDSERIESE